MMKRVLCLLLVFLLLCGCSQEMTAPETTPSTEPSAPATTEAATQPTTEPVTEPVTESVTEPTEPPFQIIPLELNEQAPLPNSECFGEATAPTQLQWLLEEASDLIDGQDMLFGMDTPVLDDSVITYYHDPSILVIVWKEVINNYVYTIAEVKVADASQFRRYLAGNEYNSKILAPSSALAVEANAVVASAGDYYRGKKVGAVIYQGKVMRVNGKHVDTCMIDHNGDLIFAYAGELKDLESTQLLADQLDINFSLAFGPVLVDNGQRCEPRDYAIGEVNEGFPRAALCQMDSLHYLLVTANKEGSYKNHADIHEFAQALEQLNCQKAYALDGGQTAAISMQGVPLNTVHLGSQRNISDIIYFATAIRPQ